MAFEIKRNDRRPYWRTTLTENGNAVNVTTATAVTFTMRTGTTIKINKEAMVLVDAAEGIVEYRWSAGSTDTAGSYNAEVEVDWGAGITQTFPSKGYNVITIYEDLDTP